MDIDALKDILSTLHKQCEAEFDDLGNTCEEYLQWLSENSEQVETLTSKSSFLLPKTPTAKRRLKKRCPIATISEEGEIEVGNLSGSKANPNISYDTRSTRITRSTRQNSERVSPVLSTRNKRNASKIAHKKIKQQVNISLISKIRQSAGGSTGERQNKRQVSSGGILEEDLRPRKSRRLEQTESILPLNEVENIVTSDNSNHIQDVIKSMFPLVEKIRISSITNRTYVNGDEEELGSPDHVTSSVCDESPHRHENRQKLLRLSQNLDDSVPTSTVNTETMGELPSILVDTTEKVTESIQLRKSVRDSRHPIQMVDSHIHDEQQTNKPSIHSLPDMFNDTNENNNAGCEEKETEPSFSGVEDCAGRISEPVCKSARDNQPEKEMSDIEVDAAGPNVTFIKASDDPQDNSVCAKVLNVTEVLDQPTKANELISEQQTMSCSRSALHQSSQSKVTKPRQQSQKSAQVFSPFANEPVRERVAAFERLRTLSEEPVEQIPQEVPQQTMRVTRTKTRAMAKAAEAKIADTIQEVGVPAEVPKNVCIENTWKASRKSVAKAKKITVAKELREKEKIEEHELSKENSMTSFSVSKFTPYTHNYEKYRLTPLSSSNISNTSAQSGSRGFAIGSSSKGRYLINKQTGNIVVGIESFLTKQGLKPTMDDIREKREEEIRRRIEKDEEALKKREQKVKQKVEEKRRKREEKMLKVLKTREALERQKQDTEFRIQKEKEEKLKQVMQDREDKMKEQVQQKKQHAQQKAAEIEERRKQEEVARLAKLKEQEEEQRRILAARKKEQDEAEKQNLKRLAEEKEAALLREQQTQKVAQMQAKLIKEKQTKEKTEAKMKAVPGKAVIMDKTFDMPHPISKQSPTKKKVLNVDDYGIDSSAESSEDEEMPKRPIPHWARKEERLAVLKMQTKSSTKVYGSYFTCEEEERTPDLCKIFGIGFVRRTSSAVWRTPPRYSTLPKY